MTVNATTPAADPFAGAESFPSLSFKDKPVGTSYTGTVTSEPSLVQSRNFDSRQPEFWSDGNPKMTVATNLRLDSGEEVCLWASKPSAMFRAIADAAKNAGTKVSTGGRLTVTFSGEKPDPAKPHLNPQKLYTVTYQPPNAFAEQPQTAAAQAQAAWGQQPAAPAPGFAQPPAQAAPPVAQAPQQAPAAPPAPPAGPPQATAPQWTPEQIAAAAAAGIPLPGVTA